MHGGGIPVFQPFSPAAAAISHLFIVVLLVCAFILAIVVGIVATSLARFRRPPGSPEPPPYFGNRKLEIIWTVGPTLIVLGLFVLTIRGMRQSDPAAQRQPDLTVVAHQWWWEVHYGASGVVTANEIHIPVGAHWLVRLESADVIHDFWVPQLGPKMDVVPGRENQLWLQAAVPGRYAGTCAEYCGAEHAWMRFTVVAESPSAYAAWLLGQQRSAPVPAADSARRGLQLFRTRTCVNCHSIRGVWVAGTAAPDLTHLASRSRLGAGVLPNTEANLIRWLENPQAVKPACFMPNLKLTGGQAADIASYLETLK